MRFERVLITGGAGFVGGHLACRLKETFPSAQVTAFDNLIRRGSELHLPRLASAGVRFVHGDVRQPADLEALPPFDLLIDCCAEPSVHAGMNGSPRYVLDANLVGTIHSLEAARRHKAACLFLSTSRVYPIGPINALAYAEEPTRFRWTLEGAPPGLSAAGVAEDFPLAGPRSIYGATKLASELLVQEYAFAFGMPAVINRCGVIAGPGQMGKVDQGVTTLWVAAHHFRRPLRYLGFGGTGKQVRDLLHVEDLFELVHRQLASPEKWTGGVYNVGGGPGVSVSLRELTGLCEEVVGRAIEIGSAAETSPVDVRCYLSDSSNAERDFGWRPSRDARAIVADTHAWIRAHETSLRPILGS